MKDTHTPSTQTAAAARELDAQIAERVFGWTRHPERMHPTDNRTIGGVLYCPPGHPHDAGSANVVPHYSTDISAAWLVIQNLCSRGMKPNILSGGQEEVVWTCGVDIYGYDGWEDFRSVRAVEGTAPLAICLAALKALDKE
jgi:hypothetical protein